MKLVVEYQKSEQLQAVIAKSQEFFILGDLESQIAFIRRWEQCLKEELPPENLEALFIKYLSLERYLTELIALFKDVRFWEYTNASEDEKELLLTLQSLLTQLESYCVQDVLQECVCLSLFGKPEWDEELSVLFQAISSLLTCAERLTQLDVSQLEEQWF